MPLYSSFCPIANGSNNQIRGILLIGQEKKASSVGELNLFVFFGVSISLYVCKNHNLVNKFGNFLGKFFQSIYKNMGNYIRNIYLYMYTIKKINGYIYTVYQKFIYMYIYRIYTIKYTYSPVYLLCFLTLMKHRLPDLRLLLVSFKSPQWSCGKSVFMQFLTIFKKKF